MFILPELNRLYIRLDHSEPCRCLLGWHRRRISCMPYSLFSGYDVYIMKYIVMNPTFRTYSGRENLYFSSLYGLDFSSILFVKKFLLDYPDVPCRRYIFKSITHKFYVHCKYLNIFLHPT